MDTDNPCGRQSFLTAVEASLNAYYSALAAFTEKTFESWSEYLRANKGAEKVNLRDQMVAFRKYVDDTLFASLLLHLNAAISVNAQNSLHPEDVEALKKIMDPLFLVSVQSKGDFLGGRDQHDMGFWGGLTCGAAWGGSLGSVVPGIGTIMGGIAGGVFGALGGNEIADNNRLTSRIGEVRRQLDSYLLFVKTAEPKAFALIMEKCLTPAVQAAP